MNEEMTKKMIEWIENSSNSIISQMPDFIDQFIRSNMINSAITIVSLILFTGFCYLLFDRSIKERREDLSLEHDTALFFLGLISLIMSIGLTFATFQEIKNLVTLYTAPKVALVDYLKKGNK